MSDFGRQQIFTDVDEINEFNIISVLEKAFPIHLVNASRINYLLAFDAGVQEQIRVKNYRPDIDIKCVDNVAHEAVAFNEAYHFGNPILWVQRGIKDSGKKEESEAIALLNECYSAESVESKTQENGRFIEIAGISYVFIDIKTKDFEEGSSYFTYEVLDPRYAFVVCSSKLGHKKMLGVTYSVDDLGTRHITAFTEKRRFEIVAGKIVNGKKKRKENEKSDYTWSFTDGSGEVNPIGKIPIIECLRSFDRMGCFEREIDDMLSLNLLESDILNATDESVQCIWHCNDVDFPVEILTDSEGNEIEVPIKPKQNDWLQTYTTKDGKTPFVTPLKTNFDYAGNLANVEGKRAYILEKLCIPTRNSTSGGSTGIAMDSATGWNAAENLANAVENMTVGWKMEEIRVVLSAIQNSPHVPADSPLLSLRVMDVKPNIKRNKNYELTVKSNAFAVMVSHGVNGLHALNMINAFPDNNQVWVDSKESIQAYQKSLWEKQETVVKTSENTNNSTEENINSSDDPINQVGNSPSVDKNRG